MRLSKIIITSVICSLFIISLSGCQNAEPVQTDDASTTEINNEEISAVQAHEKVDNNEIVFLDVRTQEEYEEHHLNNAILMPLQTLENDLASNTQFDKDDEIIVYCRSGSRSMQAYQILKKLGYSNVKTMAGGINQWSALGYNTCSGERMTC